MKALNVFMHIAGYLILLIALVTLSRHLWEVETEQWAAFLIFIPPLYMIFRSGEARMEADMRHASELNKCYENGLIAGRREGRATS